MAHRYAEAVRVTLAQDEGSSTGEGATPRPTTFTWRGGRYFVEIIGSWHLCSHWWDAGKSSDRTYYRVLTSTQGVYELYFDATARVWILDCVLD